MSENEASLELLQFWAAEAHIWFAQAEVQFALQGTCIVADKTKYYYAL